jgi:hypothetical protein
MEVSVTTTWKVPTASIAVSTTSDLIAELEPRGSEE